MSTTTSSLYAEDAREQLRRWDAGEPIWTIELGGLGPGYEQVIQTLAIELVRDNLDKPLPEGNEQFQDWGDDTIQRIDGNLGGCSGAQAGAAKGLAYRWLKVGPAAVMASVPEKDRHIQASKFWPRA